ncbi:hypothetical protein [Bradyrhizobium sp. BWA-3-5]|uniref:hypothetical protein n=1 Tax=Bradyrhizobium sp. BWA-3-5 TaxID=3080013 RepID=UPI00293F353D|nr:hypothetical protein [Bradyrhizobium sp. BWA-3-5]WOH63774.1 hypothetical protein RX331_24085 [Bradyrhizobium sp. BWA-3-5]
MMFSESISSFGLGLIWLRRICAWIIAREVGDVSPSTAPCGMSANAMGEFERPMISDMPIRKSTFLKRDSRCFRVSFDD